METIEVMMAQQVYPNVHVLVECIPPGWSEDKENRPYTGPLRRLRLLRSEFYNSCPRLKWELRKKDAALQLRWHSKKPKVCGPKFYEYLGKPETLEWDGHKSKCPEDENDTCKGVASLGVRESF